MKKGYLAFCISIIILLMTSCNYISTSPYNVLPGSYVHYDGSAYTDLSISLDSDLNATVIYYDSAGNRHELVTTYSYEYSSFSFELVTGTISIKDYNDFEFRWYSDRSQFLKLELVSGNGKYTMVYGEMK